MENPSTSSKNRPVFFLQRGEKDKRPGASHHGGDAAPPPTSVSRLNPDYARWVPAFTPPAAKRLLHSRAHFSSRILKHLNGAP